MKKVLLYFHTLKYLKWKQIRYRAYYYLRKKLGIQPKLPEYKDKFRKANFTNHVILYKTWLGGNAFCFLNLEKDFGKAIDWNYSEYGKLWTYNLNYFEWLVQEDIPKEDGLRLIEQYISQYNTHKDGKESFPTSLRLLNWIKFLAIHKVDDENIRKYIHQDAWRLYHNPEYHLLGNHLLENGFGLFFGGNYLNDERLLTLAENILKAELEEQILPDGGHFELSPMYHQHMLFRVLDCIQLLKMNPQYEQDLLSLFTEKAGKMLGWLQAMTFDNGDIPLFNDSANGIAPTSRQLFQYAEYLEIRPAKTALKESGYRRLKNERFDCIIDVGSIGPDYIPGHAHADTLSCVLYVDDKPFIVDTGTSTYEANEIRLAERSTYSHNTVEINGLNQSQVWGGFRVAKRAKTSILEDRENYIKASHSGYEELGLTHIRSFEITTHSLIIKDEIIGSGKLDQAKSFLHFHPEVGVDFTNTFPGLKIVTEGETKNRNESFQYAPEFNHRIESNCLVTAFNHNLITTISF